LSSQDEPTSSALLRKEWLRREKAALKPLGFKHARRDLYEIRLGEDWVGRVGMHKRAAPAGALTVFTDSVSVVLNHLPTQRLARELFGYGPKDPDIVVLGGGLHGIPSDETNRVLRSMRPSNLREVDEAVAAFVRMVEEEGLPWMRSQANMDALAATLRIPCASAGQESGRLEKLAMVSYLRGEKEEARAALNVLREEHMPSGVQIIDERQQRFYRELCKRLDEM